MNYEKNLQTIITALIITLVFVIGLYISAKTQNETIADDMSFATMFMVICAGFYAVFGFIIVWIKDLIDGRRLRKAIRKSKVEG